MQRKFQGLYAYAGRIAGALSDATEREMFCKCYLNTLETTLEWGDDGDVFIKTGDIPAMWLRDSSVQVSHYVRLAGEDEDVRALIAGTLARQFRCIIIDPYANAFNRTADGKGHRDITKHNDNVWERKYELDSLIYPFWLLVRYYRVTGDREIFGPLFRRAFSAALRVFRTEQYHDELSDYAFVRTGEFAYDTLENGGHGSPTGYTGMIWSAFRPSDDRCKYHYHIPSNMFAAVVLSELADVLGEMDAGDPLLGETLALAKEIRTGIETYGMIETACGKGYAYETDGLGHSLFMDDANVPSLLSLPYLGYCAKDDERYLRTRAAVLSEANPFYYRGKCAEGVGSPHTPPRYIWHIAVIMRALTATDGREIAEARKWLKETTAGTGYMHEGFDVDDASAYTRPWFAWANTLYAIFVMDCIVGRDAVK